MPAVLRGTLATLFLTPVLALQIACRPSHRAIVAPEQRVSSDPATVELGPTAIGDVATVDLLLQVSTPSARDVVVELELDNGSATGLALDQDALTIDGVDGAILQVSWTPLTGTPSAGLIRVHDDGDLSDEGLLLEIDVGGRVDPDGDDDGDAHIAAGGGDCDDDDPTISTFATEVWYDGIDQDCDGNDTDADGDGIDGDGGGDCDDGNDDVYPGAVDETDGVDEDCDGVVDEDGATSGGAVFVGLETSSKTGAYVESLGLFLRDAVSVEGWTIQAGAGEATPLTHDAASDPGPWLHICGPDDGRASCGVVLDPWPELSSEAGSIVLAVEGVEIDALAWDASWALTGRDLQLDSARAISGANDDPGDWCTGFVPGDANTRCD
ncbi:MAG: hypothetical protein H6742_05895 [Alphaproteobacteria bacterium]|nr:hypothetical protein [Alphaproteobacteria bacterium]